MVSVEVGYGVIPFVPVHVDHNTVEGADPWHATTMAEVQASEGRPRSMGHTSVRRYFCSVGDDVLTLAKLRRRRAEILSIARKRKASRIAVFGSVARGEARPDSDLDLLVDFEPGASLLDHVSLFQDLEELLGVRVEVVTRRALKPRDDRIRAEAAEPWPEETITSGPI
jgi:uncharacterized protein